MPPTNAPRLILASGSPRRRELLAEHGYAFRVVVPGPMAECGVCSRETPGELVARLAEQKALDVWRQIAGEGVDDDFLVACDTVAECRGRILGKPRDAADAHTMLQQLRGQEHRVHSGLYVWPIGQPRGRVRTAVSTLVMEPISPEEFDDYLESGLWEGKAGAFGYQDRTGWLRLVAGSESTVVGLPMELLAEMLAAAKE